MAHLQIHITSQNKTTNEDEKWDNVQKWHKREKKRWEDAVKTGLVKTGETKEATAKNKSRQAVIGDGDVGCTGGSSSTTVDSQTEESSTEDEYYDPGPMPKNIHDKGFVENWKEVLFPISLRKDALKFGGYSRPSPRKKQPGRPKSGKPMPLARKNKAT